MDNFCDETIQTTPEENYVFIGCYNDLITSRSLPIRFKPSEFLNFEQCQKGANQKSADFMGLQDWKANNNKNNGQCFLSKIDTFINYGNTFKCVRAPDGGFFVGDSKVNAIYQRKINNIDDYLPINLNAWESNFIEISTKYGWLFNLKLVSDGTDAFFDVDGKIKTWKAVSTNGNKIKIISPDGRSLFNDEGRLRLQQTGELPMEFIYDPVTGIIKLNDDKFLFTNETIAPGDNPPKRRLISGDSTDISDIQRIWIVPNVPSGNPSNNNGRIITRFWAIVLLGIGILFVIIIIIVLIFYYY